MYLLAPALALVLGLSYVFGSPTRTMAPSFDAAKSIAPMPVWGCMFLLAVFALTISLLSGSRHFMAGAWFFVGVLYTWWGACFAIQALTDSEASLVGWALYGWISVTHFVLAQRLWAGRRL